MCICISVWVILFVTSMQLTVVFSQHQRNQVLLAALFESGTWKDQREVQAVKEAIRDVNKQPWMSPTVLDFTFEYIKVSHRDGSIQLLSSKTLESFIAISNVFIAFQCMWFMIPCALNQLFDRTNLKHISDRDKNLSTLRSPNTSGVPFQPLYAVKFV